MIKAAVSHARTVLLMFVLLLVAGTYSYMNIPKESAPDIPLPVIYVSVTYDGISPEDSISQLLKPLEQELRGLEGLDDMEGTAYEGGANLVLNFKAGSDNDKALNDVREKVDIAKAELPTEADEPRVSEVNISLFPIITVILAGDLPERSLKAIAENLQDDLEADAGVLEAPITGIREEQLLLQVNRAQLEAFNLSATDLINAVQQNNLLVAAGSLETDNARYAIKVPGLFKTPEDVLNLPVFADGNRTVRVRDIGTVRLTFKDANNRSFVDGKPALTLKVSKRIGENIIATAERVKEITNAHAKLWPEGLTHTFVGDESTQVKTRLADLQNNITIAILLVMIVVLAALGFNNALLVAITVPGSFLTALMFLYVLGFTTNNVVLFALILSVGILVDGAIVVTEAADNYLAAGQRRVAAFTKAAQDMSWPIIASTATTLAAFLPLLFWPGIVGEFMKFMPLTLIFTLSASLLMALIFLPTLGAVLPRRAHKIMPPEAMHAAPFTQFYKKILTLALSFPKVTVGSVVCIFFAIIAAYSTFGRGIEFFPSIEPERAQILVHTNGDYSTAEKTRLTQKVLAELDGLEGIASRITTAGNDLGNQIAEDVIAIISLEYAPWATGRPTSQQILAAVKERTQHLKGLRVDPQEQKDGPSQGKPIQIILSGLNFNDLRAATQTVRTALKNINGTTSIEDNLPAPGIEWALNLNRAEAARAGTNLAAIGPIVRLATNGAILGTFRPTSSDEEIDIVARLTQTERTLSVLDDLTIVTNTGSRVPLSQFIERTPQPKVSTLHRLNQKTSVTIEADIQRGVLADDVVKQLKNAAKDLTLPNGVAIEFKGEDEDQQEAGAFLSKAFIIAIFMMIIILVTQFNSFVQPVIILTAVVLSTAGVLLGHLIMAKPFGIIMSGLGIIALAGIVVNNNIVLIDAFNKLKPTRTLYNAVVDTAISRLRPVMLTAVTTMIGLLPMALKINVDMIGRDVSYNAPSMQWWDQLSAAIVFGLGFSTILTLIVTPCLLLLLSPKDKPAA